MQKVIKAFKANKNFLIVSHYHPDGDAIGSALALGISLKKLKKKVVVYNRDEVPFSLQFLPAIKQVTRVFPEGNFDCAIMVDCAQPKRISQEFAEAVEAKRFKTLRRPEPERRSPSTRGIEIGRSLVDLRSHSVLKSVSPTSLINPTTSSLS